MISIPLQIKQFPFKPFTPKDIKVLSWWLDPKYRNIESIICDGSVRSGKTLVMSISYLLYTMYYFNNTDHIFLGDSIGALYRNVINRLELIFKARGYQIKDNRSQHVLTISYGGKTNRYYLFGANNAKSANAIRGLTAGCMFADEVAEMPQDTVTVATERCNFDRSTYWFNCNPQGPFNWFKREWIDKPKKHHVLHIPFRLHDNPALSKHVIERYERSYSGVAYQRDILGKWVTAAGLVYDGFNEDRSVISMSDFRRRTNTHILNYYCGVDWGFAPGHNNCITLFADDGKDTYLLKEITERGKPISHYVYEAKSIRDRIDFITKDRIENVPFYCDSARPDNVAAFNNAGLNAWNADKDINRRVEYMNEKINLNHFFVIDSGIDQFLPEIYTYVWKDEKPRKKNDDVMDSTGYAVLTNHEVQMDKQDGNGITLSRSY